MFVEDSWLTAKRGLICSVPGTRKLPYPPATEVLFCLSECKLISCDKSLDAGFISHMTAGDMPEVDTMLLMWGKDDDGEIGRQGMEETEICSCSHRTSLLDPHSGSVYR